LIEGDEVYVFFNNRKYEYTVTRKFILEKGEETPEDPLTNNTNVLLLISCWPPETGTRRITVEAQLK
jgi:sortase (surface protein transpeptidase)